MGETVAELGEFGMISRIAESIGTDTRGVVTLGIGDDAAVMNLGGATIASVDTMVEGRHYRPEWCGAQEVGRRAAAAAMTDIAAMGGVPRALLVSLAIPSDTPAQWVSELVAGLTEEAAVAGATLAGGDLVAAENTCVSVTALGALPGPGPVTRAGAQVGDVVAIAGRQGWAAAGLTVLSRGFRSPRALVAAYQVPTPPYPSGPEAAAAGATAMIDVSDGLLADLRHLAVASDVLIDVDPDQLPVPDQLLETSSAFNVDPLTWILAGGDDHALVATFPEDAALPAMFSRIGRALGPDTQGAGVAVNGRLWSGRGGHDHFKG